MMGTNEGDFKPRHSISWKHLMMNNKQKIGNIFEKIR